jgi:hypothetical protein
MIGKPPLRGMLASIGLLTGVVTYGAAFGGLFAVTFAYAYGRFGRISARPLSAWLALAASVALVIVPNIKYPANPPSVGNPETFGYRTSLFFLMIAISVATMICSLDVRRHLAVRWGNGMHRSSLDSCSSQSSRRCSSPAGNQRSVCDISCSRGLEVSRRGHWHAGDHVDDDRPVVRCVGRSAANWVTPAPERCRHAFTGVLPPFTLSSSET